MSSNKGTRTQLGEVGDLLKPLCVGCKEEVEISASIRCDLCACYSHANCIGIAPKESLLISRIHKRSPHLKLLCVNCNGIFNCSPLSPLDPDSPLEENAFLKYIKSIVNSALRPLRDEISLLRETINTMSLTSQQHAKPATFADKVKQANKNKIIFKPKGVKQPLNQTKSDILKFIKPLTEDIEINNVRSVANGGLIIIGCSKQVDEQKLFEIAESKLSSKYEIKKLDPVLPRVRIVGISNELTESEVLTYVKKQNPNVITENSTINMHKFWAVKKNDKVLQCELSLDLDTYKRILELGHVLVGLSSCSVFDAVSVVRCYKCNGFNHTAKYCKNDSSCQLCGKHHPDIPCAVSENKVSPTCRNCKTLRMSQRLDVDANQLASAKFKQDLFGIKTVINVPKIKDDSAPAVDVENETAGVSSQ
jgi:hypothetical protein